MIYPSQGMIRQTLVTVSETPTIVASDQPSPDILAFFRSTTRSIARISKIPYTVKRNMRAVQVDEGNKKSASSLYIADVADPVAKDHEVLVDVKAFGLNRMDIMQRMGQYPLPPGASEIIGVEFSGVIETPRGKWKKG